MLTVYLIVTGALVILARQRIAQWAALAGCHAIALIVLTLLRRSSPNHFRALRFLGDWLPYLLVLPLYKEVEVLAAAVGTWSLTGIIQQAETWLFSGHPSLYFSRNFPSVWFSGYLHFCYLAYAAFFPVIGSVWYFTRKREAFHDLMFSASVMFYSCFLFFILLPVDSPFYLFEKLPPPQADGFFYRLVHFTSERGGARGGAFPSLHVSMSTLIFLKAWRWQRRIAWMLAPLVAGVWLATVYGRFHYALDVIVGVVLAVVIALATRPPSVRPDAPARTR